MVIERVLWLDDQPEFVVSARGLISDLAPNIRQCSDAEEGVGIFDTWRPDLVLLDLRMPPGEWGGLRFLECIGKHVADTPVVALSGAGSVTKCVQAIEMGALKYIEKELIVSKLRSGILEAIAQFRAKQPLDDYARVRRLETTVHGLVLAALRREGVRTNSSDVFLTLVPHKVAVKTYERRLENKGGTQEEYLDLIDLREIIDRLPRVREFELLEAIVKATKRDDRTRWLVDLNEIRKVVAHPIRKDVTSDQRKTLDSIESLVARWAARLDSDAATDK
jgi:DNA-binding response OmpR family regulator